MNYTDTQFLNIPVGQGYRKIKPEEILLPSDERFVPVEWDGGKAVRYSWSRTRCYSLRVKEANTDPNTGKLVYTYRRKVS